MRIAGKPFRLDLKSDSVQSWTPAGGAPEMDLGGLSKGENSLASFRPQWFLHDVGRQVLYEMNAVKPRVPVPPLAASTDL